MPNSKRISGSRSSAIDGRPTDRRRFIAGTAAALAMAGVDGPARGLAATSRHSFRHGTFEITVVSDGYFVLPPPNVVADVGFLYPDTPRRELEAFLKAEGMSVDRVQLPNNIALIRRYRCWRELAANRRQAR